MTESGARMHLTVRRSGGFAGLTRVWSISIDDDSESAGMWRSLLEEVPWGAERVDTTQADRYVYRLECNTLAATIPEGELNTSCRLIIERVQEAADTRSPDRTARDAPNSENGPPPEGDDPS